MGRPRKHIWTPSEREAFASECRSARDRLDRIASTFPRTVGLTHDTLDRLARLRDLAAEDVANLEEDETEGAWFPSAPRSRRAGDGRAMTKAEWSAWGERVREARQDLRRLNLRDARAGTCVRSRAFHRALLEFQVPLFLLDHAMRQQHPVWAESRDVFYRPEAKTPRPRRASEMKGR
jgi:hypothetical protein